ncbi:hypothetical protein [Mycobacterium sp. IDR2000157661]|uniref:hypothetical protein n=1 Tax=Mycobacterium sp. IDR2000157661 TaxID=2867005 RepID=UPI001EEA6792|nr:hypothetical protein [Mycobacterium sp. IDR2000157661]ULE32305.1 hypothetical protein K3G64_19540 [Mycobacterium sp. IDR2000157661]
MASPHRAAKIAATGLFLAAGAVAAAGQAAAQPMPPIPPPPPVGPPPVPEIPPVYGQGQTPGPLGFVQDAMQTFNGANPIDALTMPQVVPSGPPPGAGPSPPLPPGTISLTAPWTSTAPGAVPAPPPMAPPAP